MFAIIKSLFNRPKLAIAAVSSPVPSDIFPVRWAYYEGEQRFFSKSTQRYYRQVNGQYIELGRNPVVKAFCNV